MAIKPIPNWSTAGVTRRGQYEGSEEHRLQVLRDAADAGAAYIDIELDAIVSAGLKDQPLPKSTKLIVSHHNFTETLSKKELTELEQKMRDAGADIAKLAMTANDICDSWTMLQLLQETSGSTHDST
jgi:3-dehydroquinate dehydratase / shikimate dehydrogenase